jgi:hypothetical protein
MASPDGVESIRIETALAWGMCSPSAHLHLDVVWVVVGGGADLSYFSTLALIGKALAAIKK